MKFPYLYKIYTAAVTFIITAGVLFGYVFPWFHNMNEGIAVRYAQKAAEHKALEAEQRSYEAGQADLHNLEKQPTKPSDLFSKDTRLVKEIQTLESLSSQNNLDMTLQISGTVTEAKRAPQSLSNIFLIPYTMTVVGDYGGIMKFMEEVEHTPFVTHINAVSFLAVTGSEVRATLNGGFFIKK